MNYEKLLEGKKALITAGADGIGYAIAKRFDQAGAKVFVCDINPGAVNKVNDVDDNIKAVECDLRQTQLISSMVEAGFDYLKEASQLAIPYVAIGGINMTNIQSVLTYKPPLVAVIRAYKDIPKLGNLIKQAAK